MSNFCQVKSLEVLRSFFSVNALTETISKAYALNVLSCQLIKGMLLDTYKITSSEGLFIFRAYRSGKRTLEEILSEIDFLLHLHNAGIFVPIVVPKVDGTMVLTLAAPEGTRYALMLNYIEGKTLNCVPVPENYYKYGRAISNIHKFADTLSGSYSFTRPTLNLEFLLEIPLRMIREVLYYRVDDIEYLFLVSERIKRTILSLSATSPVYGICHGDVDCSNVLISTDGKITPIDFDFFGLGWRTYDIASFYADSRYLKLPLEARQAFLEGYLEIRLLTNEEKQALPTLEAIRHIWSLGLYAENVNEWGSFRLYDEFISYMLSLIRDLNV